MNYLILGAILFFGIHLIPNSKFRAPLIAATGEVPYKAGFSLLSFAGLFLLVFGMMRAPDVALWHPPSSAVTTNMIFMLPVFILLAAAQMNGHIKRIVRHPLSLGFFLWAVSHLMANGTSAAVILFGGFALFGLYDIFKPKIRKPAATSKPAAQIKHDIIAVLIGLVIYAIVARFHETLFGVAVV